MEAAVKTLRLPQFVAEFGVQKGRVGHVGRGLHVWMPRRLRPGCALHWPIVVREVVIRVIVEALKLIGLVLVWILLGLGFRSEADRQQGDSCHQERCRSACHGLSS